VFIQDGPKSELKVIRFAMFKKIVKFFFRDELVVGVPLFQQITKQQPFG